MSCHLVALNKAGEIIIAEFENLKDTSINGWVLEEPIGKGADGIVYKCQNGIAKAAIKIFFREALEINGVDAAKERLDLQLMLVGKKIHPNLVEIFEGGEVPDLNTLYLVMEFVSGESLDKLIGKIPPELVPSLVEQLASAAECLEDMDIIHRDIKPANIVISDDFKKLTLLDLGIIHQLNDDEEKSRLSGDEFISTPRYCPPEFIWRKEKASKEAWRSVTFYQIGATIHDMIMGVPIFSGYDKPRRALYDAIENKTPEISSETADKRLIQTAHACLIKDWYERLTWLSWDSFKETLSESKIHLRERSIRLRQIRAEEIRKSSEKEAKNMSQPSRSHQLWQLKDALGIEIRRYLHNSEIFPKCNIEENTISQREYEVCLMFLEDISKGFKEGINLLIRLSIDPNLEIATKIVFHATSATNDFYNASWTEMYDVQSAFDRCQLVLMEIIEQVVPE